MSRIKGGEGVIKKAMLFPMGGVVAEKLLLEALLNADDLKRMRQMNEPPARVIPCRFAWTLVPSRVLRRNQ